MSFLNDVDKEKIYTLMDETDSNVKYFESMTFAVAKEYSRDLDNIMENINKEIMSVDSAPLNILENYFLELSNCLYFMADKIEQLGVYDAMSKNAYKEVYNRAYLNLTDIGDAKKKPTVAELTATAENEAQYESVVSDIYSKAYKIVKNKIDAANTVLSCISKIISKRMTEMQLTNTTPTGKQILNEDISSVCTDSYHFGQPIGDYTVSTSTNYPDTDGIHIF